MEKNTRPSPPSTWRDMTHVTHGRMMLECDITQATGLNPENFKGVQILCFVTQLMTKRSLALLTCFSLFAKRSNKNINKCRWFEVFTIFKVPKWMVFRDIRHWETATVRDVEAAKAWKQIHHTMPSKTFEALTLWSFNTSTLPNRVLQD